MPIQLRLAGTGELEWTMFDLTFGQRSNLTSPMNSSYSFLLVVNTFGDLMSAQCISMYNVCCDLEYSSTNLVLGGSESLALDVSSGSYAAF